MKIDFFLLLLFFKLIACSVNACYLALLDAGIPMSGQLSAVGCSFKDECILDPSLEQVQVRIIHVVIRSSILFLIRIVPLY